jgi:O-antigen ligase
MSHSLPRAFPRLGERFDRYYPQIIQIGLAACIWFSAFTSAAQDLWSASVVFGCLTILIPVLLIGHFRTRRTIQLPFNVPVLFVLAIFAVSANSSYDIPTSRLECWMWFFTFIGFYLLLNSTQVSSQSDLFFDLSSYVLVPLSIFCVVQHQLESTDYFPISVFGKMIRIPYQEIHSNLVNSIVLSGFVLYWIPFLWKKRNQSIVNWILLAAAGFILVLGRSWGAFIVLTLGFMYYFKDSIKTFYFKRKAIFTSSLLFFAMCAYIIFLFKFGKLHVSSFSENDRFEWWLAALRMSVAHPLSGVGLGAYGTAYPYFHIRGTGSNSAHNFPLQILAETGFLGLASILWLSFTMGQYIKRFRISNAIQYYRRELFITTALAVFCYSLININLDYFLNRLLFLLIFVPFIRPTQKDTLRLSPRRIMCVVASLILLAPLWLKPWVASTYYVEGTLNDKPSTSATAYRYYQDAVAIDDTCADGYAALARYYKASFMHTHSALDLTEWEFLLRTAISLKKDMRYIQELNDVTQKISSPKPK